MKVSNSTYDMLYEESLINCFVLKIVAIYLGIILFLSILFNSVIILVYIRFKHLITPYNVIILSIIILNLIGSLVELPIIIVTNYSCG